MFCPAKIFFSTKALQQFLDRMQNPEFGACLALLIKGPWIMALELPLTFYWFKFRYFTVHHISLEFSREYGMLHKSSTIIRSQDLLIYSIASVRKVNCFFLTIVYSIPTHYLKFSSIHFYNFAYNFLPFRQFQNILETIA